MENKNKREAVEIYGKVAPQSLQLEAAILGAIMLEPQALSDVLEIIKSPECFYSMANQKIFFAIQRMFAKGMNIDFLTVCEELKKTNDLELVGGSFYVTQLTIDVVSTSNIVEHCHFVVEKYLARESIRIASEIINKAYSDSEDIFDTLSFADKSFSELQEQHISNPYYHISHGIEEALEELHDRVTRMKETGESLTGVETGFNTLNKITAGWQKTDLIIIAARPSVGKTAFALNLALNSKIKVGLFSLEMDKEKIQMRILSTLSKVGMTNIMNCKFEPGELDRLVKEGMALQNVNLFIDDSSWITLNDIKAKARRMVKKDGVGMIIVDYLQLISNSKQGGNREQAVAEISRGLKNIAKELKIPMIALSQLNRDIDKSGGKKEPALSDLRESGAIEQDADLVGFLFRSEHNGKAVVDFKIAKHRNGKVDKIHFDPNLDIQLFREYSEHGYEKVSGYSATEYSGKLIPMAEAMNRVNAFEEDDDLPF